MFPSPNERDRREPFRDARSPYDERDWGYRRGDYREDYRFRPKRDWDRGGEREYQISPKRPRRPYIDSYKPVHREREPDGGRSYSYYNPRGRGSWDGPPEPRGPRGRRPYEYDRYEERYEERYDERYDDRYDERYDRYDDRYHPKDRGQSSAGDIRDRPYPDREIREETSKDSSDVYSPSHATDDLDLDLDSSKSVPPSSQSFVDPESSREREQIPEEKEPEKPKRRLGFGQGLAAAEPRNESAPIGRESISPSSSDRIEDTTSLERLEDRMQRGEVSSELENAFPVYGSRQDTMAFPPFNGASDASTPTSIPPAITPSKDHVMHPQSVPQIKTEVPQVTSAPMAPPIQPSQPAIQSAIQPAPPAQVAPTIAITSSPIAQSPTVPTVQVQPKPPKEEVLAMIQNLDAEIQKTQNLIANLKKPKKSEHKHPKMSYQSTIHCIYEENKEKAQSVDEDVWNAIKSPVKNVTPLVPMYKSPADLASYKERLETFQAIRPQVANVVRKRKAALKKKEEELVCEYKNLYERWKLKLKKMEEKRKKKERQASIPSVSDSQPQQIRRPILRGRGAPAVSTPPTGRRFNDNFIRSEAEYNIVISQLKAEDDLDGNSKYVNTIAKIPPMIYAEHHIPPFVDNNGLVADPMQMERERKMVNPWTDAEKATFLRKFLQYGKLFPKIAAFLDNKSTSEVINYYYLNKKTLDLKRLLTEQQNKKNRPGRKANAPPSPQIPITNNISRELYNLGSQWPAEPVRGARSARINYCENPNDDKSGATAVPAVDAADTKWNDTERELFLDALGKFGKDFRAISQHIGSKNQFQCKNFYHNSKKKMDLEKIVEQANQKKKKGIVDKTPTPKMERKLQVEIPKQPVKGQVEDSSRRIANTWSDEDRSLFLECFSSYGKNWKKIADRMKGKTQNQIKYYYQISRQKLNLDSILEKQGRTGDSDDEKMEDEESKKRGRKTPTGENPKQKRNKRPKGESVPPSPTLPRIAPTVPTVPTTPSTPKKSETEGLGFFEAADSLLALASTFLEADALRSKESVVEPVVTAVVTAVTAVSRDVPMGEAENSMKVRRVGSYLPEASSDSETQGAPQLTPYEFSLDSFVTSQVEKSQSSQIPSQNSQGRDETINVQVEDVPVPVETTPQVESSQISQDQAEPQLQVEISQPSQIQVETNPPVVEIPPAEIAAITFGAPEPLSTPLQVESQVEPQVEIQVETPIEPTTSTLEPASIATPSDAPIPSQFDAPSEISEQPPSQLQVENQVEMAPQVEVETQEVQEIQSIAPSDPMDDASRIPSEPSMEPIAELPSALPVEASEPSTSETPSDVASEIPSQPHVEPDAIPSEASTDSAPIEPSSMVEETHATHVNASDLLDSIPSVMEEAAPLEMPSSETPSEMPSSELPSSEMPLSEMPPSEMASSEMTHTAPSDTLVEADEPSNEEDMEIEELPPTKMTNPAYQSYGNGSPYAYPPWQMQWNAMPYSYYWGHPQNSSQVPTGNFEAQQTQIPANNSLEVPANSLEIPANSFEVPANSEKNTNLPPNSSTQFDANIPQIPFEDSTTLEEPNAADAAMSTSPHVMDTLMDRMAEDENSTSAVRSSPPAENQPPIM